MYGCEEMQLLVAEVALTLGLVEELLTEGMGLGEVGVDGLDWLRLRLQSG